MSFKHLICAALLCALSAHTTRAAPILTVTPLGLNASSNRQWDVHIAPDPNLLPSALAVELAFAIDGTDLVGVNVNTSVWDYDNPGHNPFTGTITDGLWLDLIGDRTFGAFGSMVLNTSAPARLFTIETLGGGDTTVRYGTAASASGNPAIGARIAQAAQNFDGYTGSVNVPEPTAIALAAMAVALAAPRRQRIAV